MTATAHSENFIVDAAYCFELSFLKCGQTDLVPHIDLLQNNLMKQTSIPAGRMIVQKVGLDSPLHCPYSGFYADNVGVIYEISVPGTSGAAKIIKGR